MKANELRIGNLVNYDSVCTIFGIWMDEVNATHLYEGDITIDIDSIKPIPLTEKMLIELGGQGTGKTVWFRLGKESDLVISLTEKTWFIHSDDNYELTLPRPIEYIHQLQNLYFALTNQELTIK